MIRATLAAFAGGALAATSAAAHHGWSSYDSSRTVTIEAPVKAIDYQNPHVMVHVDHEGKAWHLVLAPISRMRSRGLPADSLKVGDTVKVEGYASTSVDGELRAERITTGGSKTTELR